jgi:carboxyl-terminal processing protease
LRGVTPDIAYPSFTDADSYGESSYDNALPWVQIKPANYHAIGNLKDVQGMLQVRHEMRIAKDKEFQFIKEDIAEFKKQKENKVISLNEEERRTERDLREKKSKEREAIRAALDGKTKGAGKADANKLPTQDDGLQGSERSLAAELAAEKASKEAKDVYLIEAAHILSDEIELAKSSKRLADKTISRASAKSKEMN